MASKIVGVWVRPGEGVSVIVEHTVFDSYSRSVGPRAVRELNTPRAIALLKQSGWPGRGTIWQGRWEFDLAGADTSKNLTRTLVPFVWVEPGWAE